MRQTQNDASTNTERVIVLGFFHTSDRNRILQSPYHSIVSAFESLGVDLKIIWTNDLVQESIYSFSNVISEEKIIQFIHELKPAFVLSMNNGGMSRKIREAIHCPVVKWLFDDLPHLFFHDGIETLNEAFLSDDIVVTYTSSLARRIDERYPFLKTKPYFLPHATDTDILKYIPWTPKYKLAFVGSCLDIGPILQMLAKYNHTDQNAFRSILAAIEILRKNYDCDFEKVIQDLNLTEILVEEKLNWLHFKRLLSDVISTQDRVEGVLAVKSLGLKLFGGTNWIVPLLFGKDTTDCFQFGETINTQDRLTETYQCTRISIDLPNIQNFNALSGRVTDVMASGSLLITRYQEDSDAFKLFGPDCPIPMYRNPTHLRELCNYYLEHEEERLELVKKCNDLVASRFNFKDRVVQIFSILKIELPKAPRTKDAKFISAEKFIDHNPPPSPYLSIKQGFNYFIGKVLPRFFRQKLLNLLLASVARTRRKGLTQ